MVPLKQSTALTIPFFAHDVNGDGVTGIADGSWTKRIRKDGGSWGAMTVTIAEGENGWYDLPLSTSHTDTNGPLAISLSASGAKRVNLLFRVGTRLVDDLAYPATSGRSLDVDASGKVLLQATQSGVTIPTVTTITNAVTVGTNNDKTGYTVSTVSDKTGYSLAASQTFNNTGTWTGGITGDVGGKVLGGGAGTITGTGARVVDASGNNVAPASTALTNATWTDVKAGYVDVAISSRLAPTVASRTLDVTAAGEAGIDWANIGSPTTSQNLSGTTISTTQAVASVAGGVTVTTNNDKAGYSISGTKTTLDALNDLTTAQVNAEVDTALADINLDHLVGTATGIPAITSGTYLDQIMDNGTASFDRTTDSLQAIRDRGDTAWGASGSGDWTPTEKEQIRYRLGIDGTESAPVTNLDTNVGGSSSSGGLGGWL